MTTLCSPGSRIINLALIRIKFEPHFSLVYSLFKAAPSADLLLFPCFSGDYILSEKWQKIAIQQCGGNTQLKE